MNLMDCPKCGAIMRRRGECPDCDHIDDPKCLCTYCLTKIVDLSAPDSETD